MVDEVGPHVDVQVYTYTCSVQFSCVVLCSVHQYEYLYSSSFLVFTNQSIVALPPSSIYLTSYSPFNLPGSHHCCVQV